MISSWGPWADREYFLDKMTLRDLMKAFITHYSTQSYIAIILLCSVIVVLTAQSVTGPVLAAILAVAIYPLIEYLIHRFLLHSRFLFKRKFSAKVWKRIHYDHHQNPHDLKVLFGALYTTLPAIAFFSLPLGWMIAGTAGSAAAFAAACAIFSVYEFCHCVQHLPFKPKNKWLRAIKQNHLAHHFHSEHGNFGITTSAFDHVFGTYYPEPKAVPRSRTTFNLGYDAEARKRYPWVAEQSASDDVYAVRRKRRAA